MSKNRKQNTMLHKLKTWSEAQVENFIHDIAKEVYGACALFGILSLNAGIVLLVCWRKDILDGHKHMNQVVVVIGPVFVISGVVCFIISIFIYKKEKRRKKICCCTGEDLDNDDIEVYIIEDSESPISFDLETEMKNDTEEVRSAFRKVSRSDDCVLCISQTLQPSCQPMPCRYCTDFTSITGFRYINGCQCWYCIQCAGLVDSMFKIPQVTLV